MSAIEERASSRRYDAIIVGAGPNGLAAAITLAAHQRSVLLVEGSSTCGGGTRSLDLTLPGFVHDVCSAVHPLGIGSPFFQALPLEEHGLEWIHPPLPLAHPLDDGGCVTLRRSIGRTAEGLGTDVVSYQRLMAPLAATAEKLVPTLLAPPFPPVHPWVAARFAFLGLRSVRTLALGRFRTLEARALLAGLSAHSMLPLEQSPTAAFGLTLALLGHVFGWPVAAGGSQCISDALVSYFLSLGGEVLTDAPVRSMADLPASRFVLFDVSPRRLLRIADGHFSWAYRRQLEAYRYGPGSFKIDWALDGPVPWRSPEAGLAGTVHLGGTLEEIARSEHEVSQGVHPERPYVLLAQQSLFDRSRAPQGKQTLWGYCHVPHGSGVDMTARVEAQIERFAPGFKDRVLDRYVTFPADLERYNPNYVGGDINGGAMTLRQIAARPAARLVPYSTPDPRIYLCSASTPPGGGVHGMCGYNAAHALLRRDGHGYGSGRPVVP